MILHMVCSRNENGYDITSQNYFRELKPHIEEKIDPVTRQSFSEARMKFSWQGMEYLLDVANQEDTLGNLPHLKYQGHTTRAVDGTWFIVPRTEELLEHFTPRRIPGAKGELCHYPTALLVTAINVFTGQPVRGLVNDYHASERAMLLAMIQSFSPGDLSLLDRGFAGANVFYEFERHGQFFICRMKTGGDRVAFYIQDFLKSGLNEKTLKIRVIEEETKKLVRIKIRLIRGPKDSEGKRIVFATNLLKVDKYTRKSILNLYHKRWDVETLYHRVKCLIKIEKFHARSLNGILQEIYASLLVLSLTAMISTFASKKRKLDPKKIVPSFKNATEVVRRHMFDLINHKITGADPKELAKALVEEVGAVLWKKQPGRSYPRVSRQPIKKWNLKKAKKIQEFEQNRRKSR